MRLGVSWEPRSRRPASQTDARIRLTLEGISTWRLRSGYSSALTTITTTDAYADLSTGLSPGEQSAALLGLAVQTRSMPLVLGQPEDELGYRFVAHLIVPKVLEAKFQRQIIVVTDNANIPVLGDADYVLPMDNQPNPGGGRSCAIVVEGTFESEDVRAALLELEGGANAFRFRQHRYRLS